MSFAVPAEFTPRVRFAEPLSRHTPGMWAGPPTSSSSRVIGRT